VSLPYDEAYDERGEPRPHYAGLLGALGDPGELAAEACRRLAARGVIGELRALKGVLLELPVYMTAKSRHPLSCTPSMLSFVTPRRRLCRATGAAPTRWIVFAGLDVVRTEDGSFRVIEDQLRMPSGVAYAVAWRETLRDLLPVDPPQRDVSTVFGELALALRDAAPAGVDEPRVTILSEGPSAEAFWEHERLSRELCAALVTLDDLDHRDGRVVAWIDGHPRTIDVVYLRTGEDRFTGENGSPTAIGEALLGPAAAGRVTVANAPGSGVADDKLIHGRVDDLVRLYLGQEPLLPSVPARIVGPDEPLDGLVVKPRTVVDGRLEPRHVDLRPYALPSAVGVRVLPACSSRVAFERGSLVVNSAQGGGAKDTWVPAP
jgi:uncharacterized circularly permuted ATP-grasp superfamily protein